MAYFHQYMCTAESVFKSAKVPFQQYDALNTKCLSVSFRFRYSYKRLQTVPHASSLGFNPTLSAILCTNTLALTYSSNKSGVKTYRTSTSG